MAKIPTEIQTHLAWQFEVVLPGHFRRDKQDYADIDFPILAPLLDRKAATAPHECPQLAGPFIYFVIDGDAQLQYVGKSKGKTVIKRWVRPGIGGPTTHYWTHTNKSAGCVRRITEGILAGRGPFQLRFLSAEAVPQHHVKCFALQYSRLDPLEQIEKGMMSLLRPVWNDPRSYL